MNQKTPETVLEELKRKARPDQLSGMAKFGMNVENRYGISIPELRRMSRQIGQDHQLALALWRSGIAEARILASMIAVPAQLTSTEMDDWVTDFDSWDVCDQVCMNLFDKSPLAWEKVLQWSVREEEFVKRAAFALIACLAWHDRSAADERFIDLIPVILIAVTDDRNFIKKSVSWALRHIGKRNERLYPLVLKEAEKLISHDNKTARWIGKDTIRDLNSVSTLRKMQNLRDATSKDR